MSAPNLTSPSVGIANPPDAKQGKRRWLVVGALVLVLVVSVALPVIFLPISEDVTGAHTAFHVLGILTCIAGVILLHLLRPGATRTVAVMSWIVTVFLIAWLIGHLGELATVFTHGGVAHDSDTFDQSGHMVFASIAVPSWMLAILSFVVLLLTIAIQAIARRARTPHRRS